jgi:hypothetical protein
LPKSLAAVTPESTTAIPTPAPLSFFEAGAVALSVKG